ncbi:hypothetical protein PEC18_03860 [Paucibacter sp. O1-1]|nr:hypothetical protein [Paucibacter sp. O1-1]MDA3825010.1 hypothetical protein [Paucibacter sp. O1-1]
MPWRQAVEARAGVLWFVAAGYFTVIATLGTLPRIPSMALACSCLLMAVRRFVQAARVLRLRGSLGGQRIQILGAAELARLCSDQSQVFLGFGFEWRPVHAQRLYELAKVDYREFAVPIWLQRVLGQGHAAQPDAEIGLPYIHGVEPREHPLHRPLQNFEGVRCWWAPRNPARAWRWRT